MSAGITILEDDPYSALWFDKPAPPPILALAEGRERACHSRLVAVENGVAGLRIGWAVLPQALVAPIKLMKSTNDLHSSIVSQAIGERYLSLGRLESRVVLLRQAYARKARTLAEALKISCPSLAFDRPPGGMFLWARITTEGPGRDGSRASGARPRRFGGAGRSFLRARPRNDRLRLSFSQGSEEQLAEGARRLGRPSPKARDQAFEFAVPIGRRRVAGWRSRCDRCRSGQALR